jgi:2-polyprenyl-3-methyl-5-hydroxy-6-metoxy-1,4-benzoquinol methylase
MISGLDAYPRLSQLTAAVLTTWPAHEKVVTKSYAGRAPELMDFSELISEKIIQLSATIDGGLAALAVDYRFLCERIIVPEELHFRRTGEYRLKTFDEALRTVYSNTQFMARYMNGLLMTGVLWANHTRAWHHYNEQFLPRLANGTELLEIGPGHGFLVYLASRSPHVATLTAWDVSQASLDACRHATEVLGVSRAVAFELQDIFNPAIADTSHAGRYDAIVLSEVLEHLEDPKRALRSLYSLCKPGGMVWINVPANSPAPDHLFLLRSPQEADALLQEAGFQIIESASFPTGDVSSERAIKQALTISCAIIARRPTL